VIHLLGFAASKTSLAVMASGTVTLLANLVLVRAVALRLQRGSETAALIAVFLTAPYYSLTY
jgi:hypothetical protein